MNYFLRVSQLKSYYATVQKDNPAKLPSLKMWKVEEAESIPAVPEEALKPKQKQSSKKSQNRSRVHYDGTGLPIEEPAAQEEPAKKKRKGKKKAELDVSTFLPALPEKSPSPHQHSLLHLQKELNLKTLTFQPWLQQLIRQ